jgi:EAL domain-containing protein (putative c-di-GMP-specific phosphodiesterase class I)
VSLIYRPIVDLTSGDVVGVEALARWVDAVRGPVPPAEFIPVAEETGLVVPLGYALLRKACRQAAVFQAAAPHERALTMSVNPSSLVLEITESAMIDDVELAIARLEELRALGVLLAIDDFGTGYSSLTYIRRFPVDVLKIDRSFIQDVGGGSVQTEAMTASILQLAAILELEPVAEGIEDAAQLARLVELGCTLGQGYHVHRPMTADDVQTLVRAQARRAAPAA